ncbi:MAG: DUF4105 domain-containing protein [Porphyromonas sp.]|nr:DUF4105 domain-containing protein [Porphyromonas sp.]
MIRRLYLPVIMLLALLVLAVPSRAEGLPTELRSSARMSILVASPSSNEVYTYYGHAGLRVLDESVGLDVTFNYGIFSFSDDFLYRFVAGRTDYIVMPQYTMDYMDEYLGRGSRVDELHLSLDSAERVYIWAYLLDNIREDKREYRYQFFRDNCATRPLDILEQAVGGIVYPTDTLSRTWRQEINDLEASSPWLVLGTDLALGTPTDTVMTMRDKAFSPRYLYDILSQAKRKDGGVLLSGISRHEPYVQAKEEVKGLFTPGLVFSLLFGLVAGIYLLGLAYLGRKIAWGWDTLLFVPAGLGGLLLFYISVISEHQFVSPNYNLWILHPLHLLTLLGLFPSLRLRTWLVCYHFVNFVAVCVFLLVAYFLPQHFNGALYLTALSLAAVSAGRLLEYRRQTKNNGA